VHLQIAISYFLTPGENPYPVDYRRKHPDDFDEWGNKIYIPDYDDD